MKVAVNLSPAQFRCCNLVTAVVTALFHALVRRDGVFEAMAPVSIHDEVSRRVAGRFDRRQDRMPPLVFWDPTNMASALEKRRRPAERRQWAQCPREHHWKREHCPAGNGHRAARNRRGASAPRDLGASV